MMVEENIWVPLSTLESTLLFSNIVEEMTWAAFCHKHNTVNKKTYQPPCFDLVLMVHSIYFLGQGMVHSICFLGQGLPRMVGGGGSGGVCEWLVVERVMCEWMVGGGGMCEWVLGA